MTLHAKRSINRKLSHGVRDVRMNGESNTSTGAPAPGDKGICESNDTGVAGGYLTYRGASVVAYN